MFDRWIGREREIGPVSDAPAGTFNIELIGSIDIAAVNSSVGIIEQPQNDISIQAIDPALNGEGIRAVAEFLVCV